LEFLLRTPRSSWWRRAVGDFLGSDGLMPAYGLGCDRRGRGPRSTTVVDIEPVGNATSRAVTTMFSFLGTRPEIAVAKTWCR
jgi:hypothetical protein